MKKVELPLTRRFAGPVVDMKQALKDLESGKEQIIPLGTIDFGPRGKDLDQARINGGIIIWSAICLEEKLGAIITKFLFPLLEDSPAHKERSFFSNRIIKANHFSYATKKSLALDIVNSEALLKGREKNDLGKALKDIMDVRNAFAHGDIVYEAEKGCVLSFWMGSSRREPLTDEYWERVEGCFKRSHALIDKVIAKMGEDLPGQ